MRELTNFSIPAGFVRSHVRSLRADEVRYGYTEAWLDSSSVLTLALDAYGRGPLSLTGERIALVLSDELEILSDLIDRLPAGAPEVSGRVWWYLAMAWVYQHKGDFQDPLDVVERLYADFDYPDEIAGMVRFMPVSPGEPSGLPAIEQRWIDYIASRSREYMSREVEEGVECWMLGASEG